MIRGLLIQGLVWTSLGFAQTSTAIPSSEQATYSQLQSKLQAFNQTVSSQWNGQKQNVLFSGELAYTSANSGLALLSPGVRDKYMQELNALKALGNQAVVVKIGFPFLYQPFLQYNGDPQDYNTALAFYQQVATDIHAAGMKMIVESQTLFEGFFSSNSGLNITGYYGTISYNDFLAGSATMNATIVNQIKPDYLNVGSEPLTASQNTGFSQLSSVTGWASAIQTFVSMIPNPHPIPIGAGVGTWQVTLGSDYVNALAPYVDYIDYHVYPINDPANSPVDIPTYTISLIDLAHSLNKPVAISEAWLLKESDAEYAEDTGVASSVQDFSQDIYSFWAPLDQSFLTVMNDLANWKGLTYMSAFWTRYYWSYLDYSQVSNQSSEQLFNSGTQVTSTALTANNITSTGLYVKGMIAGKSGGLALTTAANFSTSGVAPKSIISIFGSNLASAEAATSTDLPTTLGGTSIAITDCVGTTMPMKLFFTSPLQINAVVPSGLATGNATLALTDTSGNVITGNVNLMTVNPGLFTKDGSGSGVAAAQVLTYQPDGSSSYSNAYEGSVPPYSPAPITVNRSGTTVYLVLYGSGIQGRDSLSNVSATVAGQNVTVSYAGGQGGYDGLDQVNILLPASLAGRGLVEVKIDVDGINTNSAQISIQ